MQNDLTSINIFYTCEHKSFPIHYRLMGKQEFLKRKVTQSYSTIHLMKSAYLIQMYKKIFRMQDHTKDF